MPRPAKATDKATFRTEVVPVAGLSGHPRNYRVHTERQRRQIKASLTEFGFYRNVIISSDDVILAGHGVVEAATELGITDIPVVRVPVAHDSAAALKILVGDNEISALAVQDDETLFDLLRDLRDEGELLGSGFDDEQLAALLMLARPPDEIDDKGEDGEWVGLPGYEPESLGAKRIIVHFQTEEEYEEFMRLIDWPKHRDYGINFWWPFRGQDDNKNVRWGPS